MKKYITGIILFISAIILVSGCTDDEVNRIVNSDKITVIASLFPQYDFAKQIGKDKVEVMLLLPPGVESHLFELMPIDVLKISNSDLFVFTGEEMEPWAAKIAKSVEDEEVLIVDASYGIPLEETHDDHDHDHEGHSHSSDPHIWLDPTRAAMMVDNIKDALIRKDPTNKGFYENNAEEYKLKLAELDRDYFDAISESNKRPIVFGGKFAYYYLVNHYDLSYQTAYDTCMSESEPSMRKISEIIKFVHNNDVKIIYHEEFTDPKVARQIANETGARLKVMSTLHNVTKDELSLGVTYIDIMRRNLDNLKEGLE